MTTRHSKRPDAADEKEPTDINMDPMTAQAHAQAGDPEGQPKAHRKEDDNALANREVDREKKKQPSVNAALADKLSKIADDLNKSQHDEHDVGRANALAMIQRAVLSLTSDPPAPPLPAAQDGASTVVL